MICFCIWVLKLINTLIYLITTWLGCKVKIALSLKTLNKLYMKIIDLKKVHSNKLDKVQSTIRVDL